MSIIQIGDLWRSGKGTSKKLQIEQEYDFSPEAHLIKPVKVDLQLIRLADSIAVLIKKLTTAVELECDKCTIKYPFKITVEGAEREFLYQPPEDTVDPTEQFMINTKDSTVDITDMLRQEIILQFPLNAVCSSGCRGLCTGCGINLNKTDQHLSNCNLEEKVENATENDTYKPFANLKDLLR